MAPRNEGILHIFDKLISAINSTQLAVEPTDDTDLGFRMWGGKDSAGNITKWLAKDKAARVATLTVQDLASVGTGYVQSNAQGKLFTGNITGYVKQDGTTAFTAPQTGVSAGGVSTKMPIWSDVTTAIAAAADYRVKVAADDTTPEYLDVKITGGTGVTVTTVIGGGGAKSLQINAVGSQNLQSVTDIGASTNKRMTTPGIDYLSVITPNPTYLEGRTFYDATKKTLSHYTDIPEVTINNGQEVMFRVENQTGATITNGTIIAPDATTIISKASNRYKTKSRTIAVATHDIANGAEGFATKLGQVGGLDTSMYTPAQVLYLGTDGGFETTPPDDGGYSVIVAIVDVVDPTDGVVTVDITGSITTVEVTDTNGFPPDQRTNTVITVLEAALDFFIAPTNGETEFHYYERGDKFEQVGSDTIKWTDQEGEHWFYYQEGILTHLYNPSEPEKEHIILSHAFVAAFYWDATNKKIIVDVMDERHAISMSPETHLYLHLTRGAQYVSGYSLGDFNADGDGDAASAAQFSVSEGIFLDEDLKHVEDGFASTVGMPIVYNLGANADTREYSQPGFSIAGTSGVGVFYNEWTGTEWILSTVPDRDACCYHQFGFNGQTKHTISVMGQVAYGSVNAARDGASTEISNIISQLPFAEMIPVSTIVVESRTSYLNAVGGRIRTIDGENYIPWTTTELAQGTTPSSHSNLTNVQLAGAGVSQGHINDQAQTIAGDKTFSSLSQWVDATYVSIMSFGTLTLRNLAATIQNKLSVTEGVALLDTVQQTFTQLYDGILSHQDGADTVQIDMNNGEIVIDNAVSSNTPAEIAALGVEAFQTAESLTEVTSATITPQGGWGTIASEPIRITKYFTGQAVASGGISASSRTMNYNDIVATYTGVTLSRSVELSCGYYNGTAYMSSQVRIDTSGDIKWRGPTTASVSTIKINGVLD